MIDILEFREKVSLPRCRGNRVLKVEGEEPPRTLLNLDGRGENLGLQLTFEVFSHLRNLPPRRSFSPRTILRIALLSHIVTEVSKVI
jgi:hypothetical protein